MAEKCDNCKFGGGTVNNQGLINCRRMPPTMVSGSQWPLFVKTYPNQWCGEWRPMVTEDMIEDAQEWAKG